MIEWSYGHNPGGNPALHAVIAGQNIQLTCGPTVNHALGRWNWGPRALFYADLEVCKAAGEFVAHIERGYATHALALGAAEWLKSCIEVAGFEGLTRHYMLHQGKRA